MTNRNKIIAAIVTAILAGFAAFYAKYNETELVVEPVVIEPAVDGALIPSVPAALITIDDATSDSTDNADNTTVTTDLAGMTTTSEDANTTATTTTVITTTH